eukprot:458576-Pelagomonas_calceolata.AAC.4
MLTSSMHQRSLKPWTWHAHAIIDASKSHTKQDAQRNKEAQAHLHCTGHGSGVSRETQIIEQAWHPKDPIPPKQLQRQLPPHHPEVYQGPEE